MLATPHPHKKKERGEREKRERIMETLGKDAF